MRKFTLLLVLMLGITVIITTCGSSEESIAAAIAETELASSTDTPVPPTATSTPWLTPTPQFDPIEREQVSSFCSALLEWFESEAELIAEDNAFQEQAASGNITSELRQKPAELHEISMALYTQARNLPRPGPARDAHDKLLDFAGVLVERYLIQSQLTADYTDETYNQYVDKSQEGDRLFYALFDETDDLYLRYDIDPTDCALIYRSHFPLLLTYTEKTGWYEGPGPGMAHKSIGATSSLGLVVQETDQFYIASFHYVYDTFDEEELRQGLGHIEEVIRLLLPHDSDFAKILSPIPEMIASFTGEEIFQDVKVAGLPIRIRITSLPPAGSIVGVYVGIPK